MLFISAEGYFGRKRRKTKCDLFHSRGGKREHKEGDELSCNKRGRQSPLKVAHPFPVTGAAAWETILPSARQSHAPKCSLCHRNYSTNPEVRLCRGVQAPLATWVAQRPGYVSTTCFPSSFQAPCPGCLGAFSLPPPLQWATKTS